jgi:biopolymer transport protein ExbB/TolQ
MKRYSLSFEGPFMSAAQPSVRKETPRGQHRPRTTLAAFVFGLPLAIGYLCLVHFGPLRETPIYHYFKNPVECVEVLLFGCALGALGGKLWGYGRERRACRTAVLPPWDGKPAAVGSASQLGAGLDRLPRGLQNTYLVRRVAGVLEFLRSRGSAADLDDQLRALADNDVLALEGSYGLIRFITWAIPILGFLGTVLGITQSISGVTPEKLETNLSYVTDGLAMAFDTTALALALTMVTMFLSFLVDRAEQGILEAVDQYADRQLAHRFERVAAGGAASEFARQHTQALVQAVDQVVQRQAAMWAQALDEVNRRQAKVEEQAHHRLTTALEAAFDRTLEAHSRRLAALEKQTVEQSGALVERLTGLATAVREAGREQQAALANVAQALASQTEAVARLQDGEKQLIRLQDVLNQNLKALAGAGAFDQAVHSLTAAIHLLTIRVAKDGPRGAAA